MRPETPLREMLEPAPERRDGAPAAGRDGAPAAGRDGAPAAGYAVMAGG